MNKQLLYSYEVIAMFAHVDVIELTSTSTNGSTANSTTPTYFKIEKNVNVYYTCQKSGYLGLPVNNKRFLT